MNTSGTETAKQDSLPDSATISIQEQQPCPSGEVEVTPDGGRINFDNQDDVEYRLRIWKTKTEPEAGVDILLPARGRVTVVIKKGDEFQYSVINIAGGEALSGNGGGPIKN